MSRDDVNALIRALAAEWLPNKAVGECLYRGSRDGMTAVDFHRCCDDRGPTLTLIRASESGCVCVFGGYTSASWRSVRGFVSCEDAFLFSVTGPHRDCRVTRFPLRVGREGKAMYCDPARGPCFGLSDLFLKTNNFVVTNPFDWMSNTWYFGSAEDGVYADTVGHGMRTFCGSTDDWGRFTPVDVEVHAVVE